MTPISLEGINETDLGLINSIRQDRSLTPLEESTQNAALQALKDGNISPSSSPLNPERVSSSSAMDAAFAVLNAGSEYEKWSTIQLKEMEDSSNSIIDTIELLLDLSREASALDSENPKPSEKFSSILKNLKEKGIQLLNDDGKTLNKEQLSTLKSSLGSHIEKAKTKVQQVFSKMQTVVQNMTSVNDTIKKIINDFSDLIRKIIENAKRH